MRASNKNPWNWPNSHNAVAPTDPWQGSCQVDIETTAKLALGPLRIRILAIFHVQSSVKKLQHRLEADLIEQKWRYTSCLIKSRPKGIPFSSLECRGKLYNLERYEYPSRCDYRERRWRRRVLKLTVTHTANV